MKDQELLFKHVNRKVKGDIVEYECRKGLWSVCGHIKDESRVRRETEHYFIQYYLDGEYDS